MSLLAMLAQDRKHLFSPAGDSRHRSVPCAGPFCRRATWNVCGKCDEHCPHDDAPATLVTSPGSAPAPVLLGGAS